MRKLLWIIFAVLFVPLVTPNANAQTYDITFTCQTSPACYYAPPTSPSVDLVSPNLTGFVWTWRSQTIPLSAFPPVPPLPSMDTYYWVISVNTYANQSGTFVTAYICNGSASLCDNTGNYPDPYGDPVGTSFSDGGAVLFSPASPATTPEPSTGVLMLLGFGTMMRKRYTQWRRQANLATIRSR